MQEIFCKQTFFDLKLLHKVKGKNPRDEFKDAGYGLTLQSAINKCIQYALQLLQATKYDFHPFNPLFRFLLQIAIQCDEFAYTLYWQLQVKFNPFLLSSLIRIILFFISVINSIY